jgi:uncharacterized protein YbaR (Trm112 family)
MNICVFYSKGRTYLDVLQCVRKQYPDARLYAIIPPGYPVSAEERSLVDNAIQTDRPRYTLRDLRPLISLIRQIRAAHFDAFVVMFDSPRLRIFSALSGAQQRLFCRMDGQLVPLQDSIPDTLADTLVRSIRGRLTYACIWLIVRLLHVPSHDRR